MNSQNIHVDGIMLPSSNKEDFITPFWTDLERFYPKYVEICKHNGDPPKGFKEYVMTICKELEGSRNRSAEDWFRRYLEHFGSYHLYCLCEKYS